MAKNCMEEVAHLLGVELGEEFRINLCPNVLFKFDMNGILAQQEGEYSWHSANHGILQELIYGSFDIIKLPWKPKVGNTFWSYYCEDFKVDDYTWSGNAGDYMRLKCGIVFRTEQEALEARPAKYKELTGRDWGEV